MARPATGALTAAGFTLASGTKYTKANTTAVAVADVGTGQCSVMAVTAGQAMATADLQQHLALFASLGITGGDQGRDVPQTAAGGLQYYGLSAS